MEGLLHLLDLAGRTIATLQAENASLKKQIEELTRLTSDPQRQPVTATVT